MKIELPRPSRFHLAIRRIASSRLGARFFAHTLHHLDRAFIRLSGGRSSLTALLAGLPVLTVTTVGARSGEPRSVLLVGVPDQERIILIASNWGRSHHPAWYHNLKANPETTLTYRGVSGRYLARKVEGAERDSCWNRAIQLYAGYDDYMRRTGGRQIPVFLLTPKAAPTQGAERWK
jgi:deazaflavin-dependent oxidoreductase (nitroreductase family)